MHTGFTGIDRSSQNNFDRELYERIKDPVYIEQLCDYLIDLSLKIYGVADYCYCHTMLYNSVLAPWYGTLPQLRFDVSTCIRDSWTQTYLQAFQQGDAYLNATIRRREIDI